MPFDLFCLFVFAALTFLPVFSATPKQRQKQNKHPESNLSVFSWMTSGFLSHGYRSLLHFKVIKIFFILVLVLL